MKFPSELDSEMERYERHTRRNPCASSLRPIGVGLCTKNDIGKRGAALRRQRRRPLQACDAWVVRGVTFSSDASTWSSSSFNIGEAIFSARR
jgi:hypothetical protein